MLEISDEHFERLIGEALDELPEKYVGNMQNVAITYEDEPTPRQREQLKLHCHETLFGSKSLITLGWTMTASTAWSGRSYNSSALPMR